MLIISAFGLNRSVGKRGGGVGEKTWKMSGFRGVCLLQTLGICRPNLRVQLRDAPQLNNGTEIARKFEVVFGDKFWVFALLHLTRFSGMALTKNMSTRANSYFGGMTLGGKF